MKKIFIATLLMFLGLGVQAQYMIRFEINGRIFTHTYETLDQARSEATQIVERYKVPVDILEPLPGGGMAVMENLA